MSLGADVAEQHSDEALTLDLALSSDAPVRSSEACGYDAMSVSMGHSQLC